MKFVPVNRHILVQKQEIQKEEHMVLVPTDYKPRGQEYVKVKVLRAPKAINISVFPGDELIVREAFIEEVSVGEETIYLVLENHVMGVVKNEEDFE